MFNEKQIELSYMLFERLKSEFPEIELVSVTETAYNPNDIWVNIIMPSDEDREFEMREIAAEISADILSDYGYVILISSASTEEKVAA